MRIHREFSALNLWQYGEAERRIAEPANVTVVRFELVRREGVTTGWLDVLLETSDSRTVLSPIQIDLSLLARNHPAALIYPHAAEMLFRDDAAAATMTDFLLPAVHALTRARILPLEDVWYVRPSAAFDRARAALQPGAAPLAATLPRIARWSAAISLAGGGPVAIRSRDAALGAAVATQLGSPVTAGSADDPDGWFPRPTTAEQAPNICIADRMDEQLPAAVQVVFEDPGPLVAVVRSIEVVEPLPMDLGVSYDRNEGPVVARAWVVRAPVARMSARPRTPLASPIARALTFIVRSDFHSAPDSDTDEVNELVARVRGGDGEAVIRPAPFTVVASEVGLPVIWGGLRDAHVRSSIAQCAQLRLPFALVATPESRYSRWYEATIQSLAQTAPDEDALQSHVGEFDAARLEFAGAPIVEPQAERDLTAVAAALSGRCMVALAATDGPADLRVLLGLPSLEVESFGPLVPADEGAIETSAIAGGDYAFVHAPAALTSGLAAVALALRDTNIPLVIAAAAVDPACVRTLRRIAGTRTIVHTAATPAEIDALYRGATLFVDPALRSRGLSRIVRAARSGALPIVFAEAAAARLLPPRCLVPRPAVSDLRDTICRRWAEREGRVVPARLRSTVGAIFGTEESVARVASQLLTAFARVGEREYKTGS